MKTAYLKIILKYKNRWRPCEETDLIDEFLDLNLNLMPYLENYEEKTKSL